MASNKNYMLNDKFPKHIKNATSTSDGLMSSEDKAKFDKLFEFGLLTPATDKTNGIMTSEDKSKLDSIEEGANNYIHPDDENTRHVTDEQIESWNSMSDHTTNTVIHITAEERNIWNAKATGSLATQTSDGLMSKSDKIKLDSIITGAKPYEVATTTTDGLMSAEDKTKLAQLESKIAELEQKLQNAVFYG